MFNVDDDFYFFRTCRSGADPNFRRHAFLSIDMKSKNIGQTCSMSIELAYCLTRPKFCVVLVIFSEKKKTNVFFKKLLKTKKSNRF